jgi:NAD(P)-dependent dehydrogenase (short-subunit alcohol dehydrogenase family)
MSLKTTRVLIIGGTSGIGLGVATAVAGRGASPIVVSRHQTSVDRALVFTAGESLELAPLADLTPELITGFFATRFVGALSAVRAFAPRLRAGGSITLTSGSAAEQPEFGALPVSICGAMNALTTALAVELAPIRVNAVAPGIVRTPLWDALPAADRKTMYGEAAQRLPVGRIGEVDDVALAYVYCMEQTYGTGIVLKVDGGSVMV